MSWNGERLRQVAIASAEEDRAAFEAIGLSSISRAHVLDVGCFDGFNTILKFESYDNVECVVGIDPSKHAIEDARQRSHDARFRWRRAQCETYEGDGIDFDLAYFSHSFQHLADKEAGLRNAFRLLKSNGTIVIKTVDDSCKISYPDPDNIMRRLFALYEEHVLPNTPHTRFTDRNIGSKCYALLKHCGFTDIKVGIAFVDTVGRSADQRHDLFDRCSYFRGNVPQGVSPIAAAEIRELLSRWEDMFQSEDYYFASPTFMVVAQKP